MQPILLTDEEMMQISAGDLRSFVNGLCTGVAIADAAALIGVISATGVGWGLLVTGGLFCLGRGIYLEFS
ncbi:MAG TPA: hypothetical protein PLG50_11765 [bacterium]|nr:hypothetical protein [bacterium]HQG46325.1 hypothetical protein [bacterium]HQI48258.1 hypothetical protein [bacterium]HQJ65990.1 hypothetical protein [bacterium]